MKSGPIVFGIMVLVFLFFELAYAFLAWEIGDHYLIGSFIKSAVLFVFIYLYSKKKLSWAKWALSILMLLNAAMCLRQGIALNNILFFSISAYSLIFILCI